MDAERPRERRHFARWFASTSCSPNAASSRAGAARRRSCWPAGCASTTASSRRPGSNVGADARLEVDLGPPYVSRGGEKLAAALAAFGVDPAGERCLDVGASTGGFTDCLLQRGAAEVCAVDVGRGQLHERLRQDPRVTSSTASTRGR